MEAIAHERATEELAAHLSQIFDQGPEGVYVWDEEVAEDDQGMFSWNYLNRVQPLAFPVRFRFVRGIG